MYWYAKNYSQVVMELNSAEAGLDENEVIKRRKAYGLNRLPEGKTDSVFKIFLRQFQSPLIYILLVASVIVFFIGGITDSLIIFFVLFFNAIVGTIQEGRAQNTLMALKNFSEGKATVIRNKKELIIRDEEVVIGDIIILQEGEKVPADARIIFDNLLKVDESSLTGESEAVSKTQNKLDKENIPVSDQKNMVFKGSTILSGNGMAVVVATGINTEIGRIAQKISKIDTEIPLHKNIKHLSRLIVVTVFIISLGLIIVGMFAGKDLKEMFSVAVALSVSIIPEGLPIVMTLILATGVYRMSKNNVLVQRLQAVEALGQTKIIAVDKTGTLTRNEMVIQKIFVDNHIFDVLGNGYEPKGDIVLDGKVVNPLDKEDLILSARIAIFSANAKLSFLEEEKKWKVSGDPTEVAMITFAQKVGFSHELVDQDNPKVFELPFDYENKYHVVVRSFDGVKMLSVVGAPENVISICKNIWHKDGYEEITESKRSELGQVFEVMAKEGLRVVAFAFDQNFSSNSFDRNKSNLSFVGFFGMRDALREEVSKSVEKVRSAGMKVVMITGDHKLTAEAIGKEAGIYRDGDEIITGEEINQLSDSELSTKLAKTVVFARVTPEHKFRIIEAFRKRGEIVAMTGDGVNDAPSLVAADLGVAMGRIGTEVAKEASDIILLDDNFMSIVSAAEEGRGIYKTIKKVILYLFSTSVAEVLVILVAIISGYPLLFLATQIIWLNFVTDGFLVVALAMEPKEKGLMQGVFLKPNKWIIDKLMLKRMLYMSIIMALGTLYIFARQIGIDENNILKAQSFALTTLAAFQWVNVWNCRSETKSIFSSNPFSNLYLIFATVIVVFLQILALHTSFLQRILHTVPLTFNEWLVIVPIALSLVLIEEIFKILLRTNKR